MSEILHGLMYVGIILGIFQIMVVSIVLGGYVATIISDKMGQTKKQTPYLSEFNEILFTYGPDSPEIVEFIVNHNNKEFERMAITAIKVKRVLGIK